MILFFSHRDIWPIPLQVISQTFYIGIGYKVVALRLAIDRSYLTILKRRLGPSSPLNGAISLLKAPVYLSRVYLK